MNARTLFDKLWSEHCVRELDGGRAVILIDRVMLHEITGGFALRHLREKNKMIEISPQRIFAVADHAISTAPGRGRYDSPSKGGADLIRSLEEMSRYHGIAYASPDSAAHGIVHVTGPELGFIEPGLSLVCGDSHTCTLGALGALAFAVGATEIGAVLDAGALILRRPKALRFSLEGQLGNRVYSKDVMLHLLATYGTEVARGYAVEFAGSLVDGMDMEARLTMCNMAAEMGGRYALIAPDDRTADYLRSRLRLPGCDWEAATQYWKTLHSDPEACFDKDYQAAIDGLEPYVTWGTNPSQAIPVGTRIPDANQASDALAYMDVQPGQAVTAVRIDAAFIGSCTNARISDLRAAAEILRGQHVAQGVHAMCTPGSIEVKRQAEAEGIAQIFVDAGFEWRMPGCSNCGGREGPIWRDLRVISSTNRNFENRQGPGTRTHLASPVTVAASALTGHITDPRTL